MFGLVARYQVTPGERDKVLEILTTKMRPRVSQNERECTTYRINKASDDANVILLYEEYVSRAALDAHRGTKHYQAIIEGEVVPRLQSRAVEIFEVVN